ncbi:unnamed protein product [Gulo gulo]|uniref:Uncharacterized protein n=1 Tax=Gulo gulo TaxID=48420 RepID=A0A9X9LT88_GULGU|nr:unnamed protein product [Gulo gulo]
MFLLLAYILDGSPLPFFNLRGLRMFSPGKSIGLGIKLKSTDTHQ